MLQLTYRKRWRKWQRKFAKAVVRLWSLFFPSSCGDQELAVEAADEQLNNSAECESVKVVNSRRSCS